MCETANKQKKTHTHIKYFIQNTNEDEKMMTVIYLFSILYDVEKDKKIFIHMSH